MTLTDIDLSTVEHLDFEISCECFRNSFSALCAEVAIAIVKWKCEGCGRVCDMAYCLDHWNLLHLGRMIDTPPCQAYAFYVSHVPIKEIK